MKVILFKSTPEDSSSPDKFQIALTSSDMDIHSKIVPVIAFNFCNIAKLKEKLNSHDSYQGIIFTSPRCVEAVILAGDSNLVNNWSTKTIFCVGRSTAECAQRVFSDSKFVTSPGENSESLGHKIVEISLPNSCLLYPCGNLKRDTLQNILSTGNVSTDPIIVYETVENPQLESIIGNLSVQDDSPFVFFSPSGLNFTCKYIKDLILCESRPLIALGPTTKEALLEIDGVNVNNVFQCDSPSPEGLIQCLKYLLQSKKK